MKAHRLKFTTLCIPSLNLKPLIFSNHQVAIVDVDESVLEGSDMSGTHLNGFLEKN